MSLDINKIISESIQNETSENENAQVLNEGVEETIDNSNTPNINELNEETTSMDTNHCVASAISAGLGAMTFRNHLRSLTEISDKAKSRLKTAGKVALGAGAAVGAGALLYNKMKGNDDETTIQGSKIKINHGDPDAFKTSPGHTQSVDQNVATKVNEDKKYSAVQRAKSVMNKMTGSHQGKALGSIKTKDYNAGNH